MDFLTDQNPLSFYKAASAELFPDFASENWTQPEEVAKLAPAAFADPKNREFPVHNKVATMLSAVYAAGVPLYVPEQSGQQAAIMANIKAAAEVHGITAEVDKVCDYFAAFAIKSASEATPDAFALKDGDVVFYPVKTAADVRSSGVGVADDFNDRRLPVGAAREAAMNIVKRASELNMRGEELPDVVRQLASENWPEPDFIMKQAAWRAKITGDDTYNEVAKYFCEDFSEPVKRASLELWQDLDDTHKVEVSALTPAAHVVLLSGTSKVAFQKMANSYVWFGEHMIPCPVVASLSDRSIDQRYSAAERPRVADVIKLAKELRGEEASEKLAEWQPAEIARLASAVLVANT